MHDVHIEKLKPFQYNDSIQNGAYEAGEGFQN